MMYLEGKGIKEGSPEWDKYIRDVVTSIIPIDTSHLDHLDQT
jgi:hypothetical protein